MTNPYQAPGANDVNEEGLTGEDWLYFAIFIVLYTTPLGMAFLLLFAFDGLSKHLRKQVVKLPPMAILFVFCLAFNQVPVCFLWKLGLQSLRDWYWR